MGGMVDTRRRGAELSRATARETDESPPRLNSIDVHNSPQAIKSLVGGLQAMMPELMDPLEVTSDPVGLDAGFVETHVRRRPW